LSKKIRNVLIFPAGTEIGLEIFGALKSCKEVRLHGASQNISNHAEYLFDSYHLLPKINDVNFEDELIRLIRLLKIDYIFPAFDDAIIVLMKLQDKLSAKVLAPSLEICKITRSKFKTYEYLSGLIPVPYVYSSILDVESFPVFVKPDIGQGSNGAILVSNFEELKRITTSDSMQIISEYLPGEEYTVDCFSDRDKGLLYASARVRNRIRNGIAVNTKSINLDLAHKYAELIGDSLGLHGAWFFQLKKSAAGELKLLEVAPRIAGSMALNRAHGVNFPLLTIFEHERLPISIIENPGNIILDRALSNRYRHNIYFDNLYVDLDDTLIVRELVNVDLVSLIYQSINESKRIILITRHKKEVIDTLIKHRLMGLFDEIIHLKLGEKKSDYICGSNSILIDDSFSERKDVHDNLGVLTFDTGMVEILRCGTRDENL
jgi:carbamoyl-phosphate synthase large subunit